MKRALVLTVASAILAVGCYPQTKGGKVHVTFNGTNSMDVLQPNNATQATTASVSTDVVTNTVIPAGTVVSNEIKVTEGGKTTVTKSVWTYSKPATNSVKTSFAHTASLGPVLPPQKPSSGEAAQPSNKLKILGWSLIVLGVAVGGALAYFGMLYLGIKIGVILTGSGIACVFVESLMTKYPTYFGLGAMALVAYVIYDHVYVHKSAVTSALKLPKV